MVLITNPVLDLHIRTKNFSGWSGIESAAIRIGGDKLEVTATGTIFLNNVDVTVSPPATIGGYPFSVLAGPPVNHRLNMAGGQYIELTQTFGSTLQVDVLGHGSDFGRSEGLCANWTANSPNALVDRDHVTVYPLMPIQNAYGEEWQVQPSAGDPLLFQTSASAQCLYSQGGGRCKTPGTPECQNQMNEANNACANVPDIRNAKTNCVFDVLTTGDVGAANAVAYTNPIIAEPAEICTDIIDTAGNSECKKRGGRCVWRCDDATHTCIDTLCKGPTEGCSCALPMTRAPVKPNDTRAPTKVPVKPNDTRAPTKVPVKPVPVPIKPTKPPTKPPTTRKPTRAPTKKPIKKPCGVFGLNIFCFCNFFTRLIGLC